MICQKCSFILSGSEDFCPHCGTPCKTQNTPVNTQAVEDSEQIPIPSVKGVPKTTIFDTDEVYSHSPKQVKTDPPKKKGSKAATGMFLMLFLVLLCIGAVVAMDYLGIVPAISFDKISGISEIETTTQPDSLLSDTQISQTDGSESEESSTENVFSNSTGLVYPEINYKPTIAYISAQNGTSLKKGPMESFAQICVLPYDNEVQVIGGSSYNDSWVYVYAVNSDCYGWVDAAYLSVEGAEQSTE